ncbi:MAG: lipo-like protein [Gammaproteobacteria bacterium HGW-Gammaproteobacteria-11]|nr:MAG: lipo-like protein [Gammaproteobacteria bacterium HGW-Gammaproteobacteria-11]
MLGWICTRIANYLTGKIQSHNITSAAYDDLKATLRPGDVLLVDGDTRISVAIKYLTQSTWSHAALYLGPDAGLPISETGEQHVLVEADLVEGIRSLPLSNYSHVHTRICRPIGLSDRDLHELQRYAISRLGHQYDLRNIVDLARYFCPTPPVPTRFRRRMLSLGSGDPTRAICSTYIAEGFQRLQYPILPSILSAKGEYFDGREGEQELLRIRHHSLFVPRDFDASPFFAIVKPTLSAGFDFHKLNWDADSE